MCIRDSDFALSVNSETPSIAGYMLRIDCWKAEKNLKTTYGSECALTSLAVDEPCLLYTSRCV